MLLAVLPSNIYLQHPSDFYWKTFSIAFSPFLSATEFHIVVELSLREHTTFILFCDNITGDVVPCWSWWFTSKSGFDLLNSGVGPNGAQKAKLMCCYKWQFVCRKVYSMANPSSANSITRQRLAPKTYWFDASDGCSSLHPRHEMKSNRN